MMVSRRGIVLVGALAVALTVISVVYSEAQRLVAQHVARQRQHRLNTELCIAAYNGNVPALAELIAHGADPNGTTAIADLWRRTKPRWLPSQRNWKDPNRPSAHPVVLAAGGAHQAAMVYLLRHGAAVSAEDRKRAVRAARGLAEHLKTGNTRRRVAEVVQLLQEPKSSQKSAASDNPKGGESARHCK